MKPYLNLLLQNIGKNATILSKMKPNGSSAMNRSREVACLSVYFFLFHPIGMIHIYYRFLSTEKMMFDSFLATLIIASCGSIRFL